MRRVFAVFEVRLFPDEMRLANTKFNPPST